MKLMVAKSGDGEASGLSREWRRSGGGVTDARACGACGKPNRSGRRFCGSCGNTLGRFCTACGFFNDRADRFCGGCGWGLEKAEHRCDDVAATSPASPAEWPARSEAGAGGAALEDLFTKAGERAVASPSRDGTVCQEELDALFTKK